MAGQLIYLIPERAAMFVLAWWFDWLPHHDLEDTQRENRYRATRNRVGMEWLYTPLMLSQNYHLVHHLYPSVSFCRCLRTWISSAGDDGGVAGRLEAEITPIAAQDLGARWSPARYGTRWLPVAQADRSCGPC